jgi:phospholipid/cholesterol/gamma-HCH transport system permease protein
LTGVRLDELLSSISGDHESALAARGAWTALNAGRLAALIAGLPRSAAGQKSQILDMSGVDELDTYGAWALEQLIHARKTLGETVEVTGLAPRFTGLVETVLRSRHEQPIEVPRENAIAAWVVEVGRTTSEAASDLKYLNNMLGAVGSALFATLKKPSSFRLTSTVHHVDRVAWQAVPIILLITFLIGCIIAQQGFFHFRKFGADQYVVDMIGILVVREIGVLLVAIMVAGRSGSSYTAELGSMKMREEIDALSTMGLDPVTVLILPRVTALIISVPILTFLGAMSALYGGGLVAWVYGGMSPDIYIARLQEAITLDHFKVGMIKAPFMALVIGIVACAEGLKVRGSAESLGLQTTASVVKSIFLVIVLDGLFAMYFTAIGI